MRVVVVSARLAVLVLLQGCMSWQRRPFSPGEPSAIRGDGPVRVQPSNSTMVTLERTRVVGDSMIGDILGTNRRYAVALSDISYVEQKRISWARTVGGPLAYLGGMILVASALFVMAAFVGSRV